MKSIGIYDPYMHILGGAERYGLSIASCFKNEAEITLYADDKKILPFSRITGTDIISSLLGESGTITSKVDNATFTAPNGTLPFYGGCTICVPTATNEVFIAEVLYNNIDTPGAGTQTIKLNVIYGKDHTDLTLAGVSNGMTWYLMNNRYWLDLLYDRIDLYKPQLYNKLSSLHAIWKTQVIENDDITELGQSLRKATTVVNEALANWTAVECSLMFRPDYDTGMTVNDLIFGIRWFLGALDYSFGNDGIIVNCKLTNYDRSTS